MTYFEGFVAAVPTANEDAYAAHAREAFPLFSEFGANRMVEAWGDDVPRGEVTDFYRAVAATDEETPVFSWFEYPDRAARDAANERIVNDERMHALGETMPFDGKRMIFGGFAAIVDERGDGAPAYFDGMFTPVPAANREAYGEMARKMAGKFIDAGAVRVVEAWGDDVAEGETTDFRRAVRLEDGENVVFSYIAWPDKQTRDKAWEALMADPDMQPGEHMPFDGKRMFWGGFRPILDL